jgi:hypothetical protein
MKSDQNPAQFIVLEMVSHGNALRANEIYGGWNHRYLNVTGRWSSAGNPSVQLIVWPDTASASEAAQVATKARSKSVKVSTIGTTDTAGLKFFSQEQHEALHGYLPYSAAATRKLEAERLKTMRYANVILTAIAANDDTDFLAVTRTEVSKLRELYKGGSIVSAAQYLTGKRAGNIIERVLDDELNCDEGMSPERLIKAALAANEIVKQLGSGH